MDQNGYTRAEIHKPSCNTFSTHSAKALFALLLGVTMMVVLAVSSWVSNEVHAPDCFPQQLRRLPWKASRTHQRRLRSSSCQQTCGDLEIPYPFGLSPECARNSFFKLECLHTQGLNSTGMYEIGNWPFLTNVATGVAFGTQWNVSNQTSFPYDFSANSFQVLNFSDNNILIETTNIKAMACFADDGNASLSLRHDGPYRLSGRNTLIAVGCRAQVNYGMTADQDQSGGPGCGPNSCNNQFFVSYCNVYDCCSLSIPPSLEIYLTGGGIAFAEFNPCGYGTLLFADSYKTSNPTFFGSGTYGMELIWALPAVNGMNSSVCKAAPASLTESPDYACTPTLATCNFVIVSNVSEWGLTGYHCECNSGYQGDGYKNGSSCTDIDECADKSLNNCDRGADCTNLHGSYNCSCPSGYAGDGFKNGTGCFGKISKVRCNSSPDGLRGEVLCWLPVDTATSDINKCEIATLNDCVPEGICMNLPGGYSCSCPDGKVGDGRKKGKGCRGSRGSDNALIAGLTTVSGIVVIVGGLLLWWYCRRKRQTQSKDPTISRMEVLHEMQSRGGAKICKTFLLEELSKATGNFGDHNVVGIGGFGKIYRGTLDDGSEVAIKKAKRDIAGGRDDTKQFINEVTILSTVNHQNLVKLLGCCLETVVPILVYEFISNGSLLDYIQRSKSSSKKDCEGPSTKALDWDQRLKIAIDTASALSYLHFGTSPPIYHRDVKSAKILLDKKYMAKVADFGLSKLVPIDEDIEQTHSSTAVQGTPGYLDPQYFETYQMTRKSDVYSFGVVLLELLTAEKALDFSRPAKDQNLALRCRKLWRFGFFEEVLDPSLNAASDPDVLEAVYSIAEVAMECCERNASNRPTMKQVEDKLRSLHESNSLRSPDGSQTSSAFGRARRASGSVGYDFEADDTSESTPLTSREFTSSEDPVHSSKFASNSSDSPGRFRQRPRDVELGRLRRSQTSL